MDTSTPPLKLSALASLARTAKARFQLDGGWQVVTVYTDVEKELEAARQTVALADVSAMGKILVEGEAVDQPVASVWGEAAPSIGAGLTVREDQLFRLRDDLLLVWTKPGEEASKLRMLAKAISNSELMATVTDITHGRAALRLVGPDSRSVLTRLCGLNFSPLAFPNQAIQASSVAKTPQWVVRDDLGEMASFVLLGARSLGVYLWEVIMEAGSDLGIQPMGQNALEAIR